MKKNILLLTITIYVSLFLSGKCVANDGFFKFKNIDLGLNFMPSKVKRNNNDYTVFSLSYSTGVMMRFVNKNKGGIMGGFNFTNITSKSDYLIWADIDSINRPRDFDSTINKEQWNFSKRYFDLPLIFNLRLLGERTILTLNPGIVPSYSINYSSTHKTVYNDGHVEYDSYTQSLGYYRFWIYGQISLGLETELVHQISIKIEPTIRSTDHGYDNWLVGINFSFLKRIK